MSGGSMDYLYLRIEDAEFDLGTPLRKAFHKHLRLVAKALHDIEWVDSSDYGIGAENAAILACIEGTAMLDSLESHDNIDAALESVLRASGTSLKHYSMQLSLDNMRKAMRKIMSDSYIAGSNAYEDALKKAGERIK